ncbi:phosphate ABC transporter substrate-binding protein [Ignavibacteriales bacterium]
MKKINSTIIVLLAVVAFFFTGCENKISSGEADEPTMGKKKIAVDETYKPVFEELEKQFETLYPNAFLDIIYAPESKVIDLLLQDSVQLIFISRELNSKENALMAKKEVVARNTKIAYDGIALFVNKNNKLGVLSQDDLKSIFTGKYTRFNELKEGLPNEPFSLVFENSLAGTVNFFAGRYGEEFRSAKNVYDLKSPKDLINYVSANVDAIGFLSSIYVYDDADTNNTTFIKDVKVLDLEVADSVNSDQKAVGPWQYYVAQRYDPAVSTEKEPPLYPLVRSLTSVNFEGRAGLGQGFTAYVASEPGQRTVLRFGLVPARMPVRILQVTNENIQIK